MTTRKLGPVAELRTAARSPFALIVGGLVGGAAPLLNYFTIHLGHLIEGDQIRWRSPLWILVAGAFWLSSRSVYCWGLQMFNDRGSALGLMAMLEVALILAPHPTMRVCVLVLLVAINVTVYGCALALQDQDDKATAKAAAKAAADAAAAADAVSTASRKPAEPQTAAAKPKATATAAATAGAEPLYEAALACVKDEAAISTETVRTRLRVRQPKAAQLVSKLASDGIVGEPDPLNRGRRPVLISTVKNFG